MNEALAELPRLAAAHLQLSLAGLGLALALALPLGVAASRRPRLAAAALGGASVIQTIPSLALLAIMVPLLAEEPLWVPSDRRGPALEPLRLELENRLNRLFALSQRYF